MKKQRGAQMVRQWNLLQACDCALGRSVEELMVTFGASRRTIYRDLSILRSSGANIETVKSSGELRYRSSQPYFIMTPFDSSQSSSLSQSLTSK